MIRNYIKTAFRSLLKYRVHSTVNVLGLAIGIAISILILTLVQDEISYDRYNENLERIYRVNRYANIDNTELESALTPIALKEAMLKEIPEVGEGVRLLKGSHKRVSYKDTHYSAASFFYADDQFFNLFNIPLIQGDRDSVLSKPFSIVLTKETARLYFGEEDPVSKILSLDNGWDFTVTGICEEVPQNSHFHFDYLASINGILDIYDKQKWMMEMVATYVTVDDKSSIASVESNLEGMVSSYILSDLKSYLGDKAEAFTDNDEFRFYLQPLGEIHLNHLSEGEFEAGTEKVYIYVFIFVALLILVIASINYMNLATARAATRSREVALRKVMGASRRKLIVQFLSESILFSMLALFLSLVILELMLRPFNAYTGKALDIFYLDYWYLIPAFIVGAFLIGILSGSYPAFYLSSFRVMRILRGRNSEGRYSGRLRGFLVLSQFTVSIILFISSMIIYQQVRFFRETNLGFNSENIIVIQRAYAINEIREDFKEVLLKHPKINASSVSYALPGTLHEHMPLYIDQDNRDQLVYVRPVWADYDFIPTMQMHLIEGEYYESDDSLCHQSIIVNETAARIMGFEQAVGKKVLGFGMQGEEIVYTIRGVVKDYHYESLHEEINPLVISLIPEKAHPQYLAVRISGDDMKETIAYMEKAWHKFVRDEPFDHLFLDASLDGLYEQEETTANLFTIFTILALFIASLGLFGMAAHMAELRVKEIGIRKAMGASIPGITLMLSASSAKWVVYANLIAFPVTYFGMKLWLGRFAYHINIEAWMFFLAAILAVLIALFTVSYQAIRSARANPVEALQYD